MVFVSIRIYLLQRKESSSQSTSSLAPLYENPVALLFSVQMVATGVSSVTADAVLNWMFA